MKNAIEEQFSQNDNINEPSKNEKYTGYLVHLFRGKNNPVEIEVIRRLCMRFSLQAWNEMHTYLPWHSHAELRSIVCRLIQKQALSEYSNIRADPFKISADNAKLIKAGDKKGYKIKGGLIVNDEWNRSAEKRKKIREENFKKYELSSDEAYSVEIPAIMSVDYLQAQVYKRRQGLTLFHAALLYEKAKHPCSFSLDVQKYIKD